MTGGAKCPRFGLRPSSGTTATWGTLPPTAWRRRIEQVIANGPTYRQNKRGRAADLLAFGETDGGPPGRRGRRMGRHPPDRTPDHRLGGQMSNNDVDNMTEAELAEHFHRHRDNLAGEEMESRAPTRLDVMISARFSREEAAALRAAAARAGM